ncbi:lysophospholipase L1-like esterase [Rhodococcus sp. OK519]|uniref:SGNH/GDSL hydrolase family protein n=1 Tax=Rhodococcus sp. OK519 TaxID=2135729 RepID=UPI000D35DC6A|nr:lysophospholipase L1-like esterase [Rhodococcus sp. OK519]
MDRWRTAAKAGTAALLAGSGAGTASWAAYTYLVWQAGVARGQIVRTGRWPPEADGVYTAGCAQSERWRRGVDVDLHLMLFGDSTAAGMGCTVADEVPGVLLARSLAERTGGRIRLSTKAIPGATSRGLTGQVDATLVAGPAPDAAVIMVGANDVTSGMSLHGSARRLGSAVARLRDAGSVVVVGTCPDLGVITAIPQPLRAIAHGWGVQLARLQTAAARTAGGHPVPLGRILASCFLEDPATMLSDDRYHPSAAGYRLVADRLGPALMRALAEWDGHSSPGRPEPVPEIAPSYQVAGTTSLENMLRVHLHVPFGRRRGGDTAPAT